VGPILLIGAGVVLLLNTMGILDWSIWWSIVQLWPLLLIAIGVDLLIGRRSIWGSLLALLLVVAVLGGGFWLVYSGALTAQQLPTQDISQELAGASEGQVILDPGVGNIRIGPLDDPDNLVEAALRRTGSEEFASDFRMDGDRAVFTLRTEGVVWSPTSGAMATGPTWDVRINPDLPIGLDLNLGAGTCDLDLTGMAVSSVNVDLGVGRCEITFPAQGRVEGTLSGAIGETVIVVPAGVEARIEASSGIAARQIPSGFEQKGDVYVTPGYQGADNALELVVDQAIGSLRVQRASGF
jgi:hypothetical protein